MVEKTRPPLKPGGRVFLLLKEGPAGCTEGWETFGLFALFPLAIH